jgi:hypothetical protein
MADRLLLLEQFSGRIDYKSWFFLREEVKHMKSLISLFLTLVLGYALVPSLTEAAPQQRIAIKLGGRYCDFHTIDVEQALKRVAGVVEVDMNSYPGRVMIVMRAGKVNPDHLLAAVQQIKGEGYYCTAKFDGEASKIEY